MRGIWRLILATCIVLAAHVYATTADDKQFYELDSAERGDTPLNVAEEKKQSVLSLKESADEYGQSDTGSRRTAQFKSLVTWMRGSMTQSDRSIDTEEREKMILKSISRKRIANRPIRRAVNGTLTSSSSLETTSSPVSTSTYVSTIESSGNPVSTVTETTIIFNHLSSTTTSSSSPTMTSASSGSLTTSLSLQTTAASNAVTGMNVNKEAVLLAGIFAGVFWYL
ncbi:uncharacterized protein V2V93DRAFT_370324 [Kockiozyma suomiensis]|uniref:uncharacterized protein n=1 Tax=Kockiozyma suomiensis TaxID=1337062 RepID=UPI003343042C